MEINLPESLAGQRLDVAVAELTGWSKNRAKAAIQAQRVLVNGRPAAKARPVRTGQTLTITAVDESLQADAGVPIRVLQEADDWLIVDKPAGVPVLPADGSPQSLITGLMAHRPHDADWARLAAADLAAVHRLDTDTSGCVLIAKNADAHRAFREQWQNITKTYTALIPAGVIEPGEVHGHLAVTRHRPSRVEVVDADHPGARACRLSVLSTQLIQPGVSLVRVQLHTGFLHQIRVMISAMDAPILGDDRYGGDPAERLMLHAESLRASGWPGDVSTKDLVSGRLVSGRLGLKPRIDAHSPTPFA